MNDLNWLAPTILSLGALIGSVVAAIIALRGAKDAQAAKDQAKATGEAVDGSMTRLLALATAQARDEATLAEKKAQADRVGVAAQAVVAAVPATPLAAPSSASEAAAQASALLQEAALQAKTLLETAAVTAASLLASASNRKPAKGA